MKFAIDIGHNAPPKDIGARGLVQEDKLTILVGRALISILQDAGHSVVDVAPLTATSVIESLRHRVRTANSENADIFVSIHFNAANFTAYGSEVYAISAAGGAIARSVLSQIIKLGFHNRGVKRAPFYVINHTKMPAILVECCFCDSRRDMEIFDAKKMARAIAIGLIGKLPPIDNRLRTLRIDSEGTWLKPSTEQSKSIPKSQMKWLKQGKYQLLSATSAEEHHHFIKLANGEEWFIYAGHCEVT